MGPARKLTVPETRPEAIDPVLRFSRGEVTRQQAMRALGGISYGQLIDQIADRGLSFPELPAEDVNRMANKLVELLDLADR